MSKKSATVFFLLLSLTVIGTWYGLGLEKAKEYPIHLDSFQAAAEIGTWFWGIYSMGYIYFMVKGKK